MKYQKDYNYQELLVQREDLIVANNLQIPVNNSGDSYFSILTYNNIQSPYLDLTFFVDTITVSPGILQSQDIYRIGQTMRVTHNDVMRFLINNVYVYVKVTISRTANAANTQATYNVTLTLDGKSSTDNSTYNMYISNVVATESFCNDNNTFVDTGMSFKNSIITTIDQSLINTRSANFNYVYEDPYVLGKGENLLDFNVLSSSLTDWTLNNDHDFGLSKGRYLILLKQIHTNCGYVELRLSRSDSVPGQSGLIFRGVTSYDDAQRTTMTADLNYVLECDGSEEFFNFTINLNPAVSPYSLGLGNLGDISRTLTIIELPSILDSKGNEVINKPNIIPRPTDIPPQYAQTISQDDYMILYYNAQSANNSLNTNNGFIDFNVPYKTTGVTSLSRILIDGYNGIRCLVAGNYEIKAQFSIVLEPNGNTSGDTYYLSFVDNSGNEMSCKSTLLTTSNFTSDTFVTLVLDTICFLEIGNYTLRLVGAYPVIAADFLTTQNTSVILIRRLS